MRKSKFIGFVLLAFFLATPQGAMGQAARAPGASAKKIQVQAHRGGRSLRPENTLPAFRHALELGVDVLELDMGVSQDGVLVVSHDPHVNPLLCHGPGHGLVPASLALHSLPYAKIREFDCGAVRNPDFPKQVLAPGAPIPTLDDVLSLGLAPEQAHVEFNIETKIRPDSPHLAPPPEEFARLVIEAVRKRGLEKRVVVQSFDFRTLRAVRQVAPEIRTSALDASGRADFVALAREAKAGIISPEKKLVTPARVKAAHAAGLQVIPWTANTRADWQRLIAAGVDGIITDDPAGLIEYLKSRGLR